MITRSAILEAIKQAPDWFWTDSTEENLDTLALQLDVDKWQLAHSPLRDYALETIALRKTGAVSRGRS